MAMHPRVRRGLPLSPVPATAPVLALDLGGTRIRSAVVHADGSRTARTVANTPKSGRADVVDACTAALRDALARAVADGDVRRADIAGIGISSPGPVDPFSGTVLEPPNLGTDFVNVPLAPELSERFGLPAVLDRDTNVALLGEREFGAARSVDDVVYLTVSTGVGGAILAGGVLVRGPDGLAGELGHIAVDLDGPRCGCGGVGHVEAIASGVALAREAQAALARGDSPFLAERAARTGNGLSARDVTAGEAAGDPTCSALMALARRAIAAGCVSIANALNPHRIIVGGAIAAALGESLREPIRIAIATEVFPVIGRRIDIVPPELGDDVSLAGGWPLVHLRFGREAASRRRPSSHDKSNRAPLPPSKEAAFQ